MRLLVCRMCADGEPFACPYRFRRTDMQLHLEKAHGLKLGEGTLQRAHETRSGPVLWRAGKGNDAKLVLEEVAIAMPGAPAPSDGDVPPLEDVVADAPALLQQPVPTPAVNTGPDFAKQLAAAYRAQYGPRGDPHGPAAINPN